MYMNFHEATATTRAHMSSHVHRVLPKSVKKQGIEQKKQKVKKLNLPNICKFDYLCVILFMRTRCRVW